DIRWASDEDVQLIAKTRRPPTPVASPPSPYKEPRGRGLRLPSAWPTDAFSAVLLDRRTWRGFGRRFLTQRQLGILLDLTFGAGHVCQTFCLVATWLKLAPFCTQALADSRIEQDLGANGVDEILLYAAGVGTRPADGRWVQWPSTARK